MPPTTFGWVLSRSDGTTRRGRLEHAEWADLTLEQVLHKLDEVVPEIPRDKRRLIHLGKILNKGWGSLVELVLFENIIFKVEKFTHLILYKFVKMRSKETTNYQTRPMNLK